MEFLSLRLVEIHAELLEAAGRFSGSQASARPEDSLKQGHLKVSSDTSRVDPGIRRELSGFEMILGEGLRLLPLLLDKALNTCNS